MAHRRSGLCRPERKDSGMVWLPSILGGEIKLVFPPVPVADTMLVPFLYHGTSSSKQLDFFSVFCLAPGTWPVRLYIHVVVMGSTVILSTVCLKYRATCHVTNPFFLGFQEDDCPARLWKEAEILMGWELGVHSLPVASQSICSILKCCPCWEDNG